MISLHARGVAGVSQMVGGFPPSAAFAFSVPMMMWDKESATRENPGPTRLLPDGGIGSARHH